MQRIERALELAWLVVGLVMLATGLIICLTQQIEGSYLFFIFTPIAALMYYLRRTQRIRYHKNSTNQNPQ